MKNDFLTGAKAWIIAVIVALTAFWGWFGWLLLVWIGLMLADWLVGSAAAAKRGEWSSAKLREGAWHKGGMIVIVCVAMMADWLIGMMTEHLPGLTLPFVYTAMIGPLVVVWYIMGELGSLAEHGVNMGAPMPNWLVKLLAAGKRAVDAAGETLSGEETEKDENESD